MVFGLGDFSFVTEERRREIQNEPGVKNSAKFHNPFFTTAWAYVFMSRVVRKSHTDLNLVIVFNDIFEWSDGRAAAQKEAIGFEFMKHVVSLNNQTMR